MDLSFFATPEAWISLITLIFLEIVLGVDNIVFITITANKLPAEKRSLGRKLGLLGAFVSRALFLCFASYLVHMADPLFNVDLPFYSHGFSVRDLVMLAGGVYLIYKGIDELRDLLGLVEEKEEEAEHPGAIKHISIPQAVATIMVMDVVFSIDSVITAVGLANQLIIMVLAVFIAILIMIAFIDPISDFIESHMEMKILALVFIAVIGLLLGGESLGIETGVELLGMSVEKLMVYFAMVFSVVLELIQMRYNHNYAKWREEQQKLNKAAPRSSADAEQ